MNMNANVKNTGDPLSVPKTVSCLNALTPPFHRDHHPVLQSRPAGMLFPTSGAALGRVSASGLGTKVFAFYRDRACLYLTKKDLWRRQYFLSRDNMRIFFNWRN